MHTLIIFLSLFINGYITFFHSKTTSLMLNLSKGKVPYCGVLVWPKRILRSGTEGRHTFRKGRNDGIFFIVNETTLSSMLS